MRGVDRPQSVMFSYVHLEDRVPEDHPLRAVRKLANEALRRISRRLGARYSHTGRPSIPPEQLLRALLLQCFYTIRSERLLMEQLDYNLLFRWFVGLEMDDPVWDATVFSKNRERLLEGDVAEAFFQAVVAQAREAGLLSDEHFTVDGTLIEAWAGQKSFRPKDEAGGDGSAPRCHFPRPWSQYSHEPWSQVSRAGGRLHSTSWFQATLLRRGLGGTGRSAVASPGRWRLRKLSPSITT
jgi:transposase